MTDPIIPQTPTLELRIDTALRNFFSDLPRMAWWLLFALAGLAIVYFMAPQMVKVTIYKLSLMPAAAYVAYRIDRAIGEKERPHEMLDQAAALRAQIETISAEDGGLKGLRERDALRLEEWARDRYRRRYALVCAALLAVALGS